MARVKNLKNVLLGALDRYVGSTQIHLVGQDRWAGYPTWRRENGKGRPRCGQGKLYAAYLKIAPRCTVCGLDYGFADAGDGPAVFVILIAGAFIVACALFVEVNYRPPYWLHAVLWLPLTLTLCLGMLPPFKATLFALQYRNQAGEGRMDK